MGNDWFSEEFIVVVTLAILWVVVVLYFGSIGA